MTFISAWESAQSQLTPLLLLCLDPKVQPMAKEKCLLDLRAISQDGKSQVVHVPGGEKKKPQQPEPHSPGWERGGRFHIWALGGCFQRRLSLWM